MANKPFDNALKYGSEQIAAMDLRLILVMTNTTVDPDGTDLDVETVGDIGTLDECDGANYVSGGVAFSGEVATLDRVAHNAGVSADPLTFGAVEAGTRDNKGMILVRWDTDLASSEPLFWYDDVAGTPTFPFNGNGTDIVVTPDALGLASWSAAA